MSRLLLWCRLYKALADAQRPSHERAPSLIYPVVGPLFIRGRASCLPRVHDLRSARCCATPSMIHRHATNEDCLTHPTRPYTQGAMPLPLYTLHPVRKAHAYAPRTSPTPSAPETRQKRYQTPQQQRPPTHPPTSPCNRHRNSTAPTHPPSPTCSSSNC